LWPSFVIRKIVALQHTMPRRLLALTALIALFCRPASGQAPGFLWMTNVGARVFAIDSQTNVYADVGGKVIQINGAGVPVQTNVLSQYPGRAQRDAAGNFYYAGVYPGIFTGGSIYLYTSNSCFLAKYDSAGSLVRTTTFGPQGQIRGIAMNPPKLDPAGNCLVGFTWNVSTMDHSDVVAKFDSAGSNVWSVNIPKAYFFTAAGSTRLGPFSATDGYALSFVYLGIPFYVTLSHLDSNGVAVVVTSWQAANNGAWHNELPVANTLGEFYEVEGGTLVKRSASGNLIWSRDVPVTRWTLCEDRFGGVHAGDDGATLSRYDYDGNEVWTTNLSSPCNTMVIDVAGNRFISLDSGVIARLGDESLSAPSITADPQGQTVLAGSNVVFSAPALGSGPLRYFWLLNGSPVPNGTNTVLVLNNVVKEQAGVYSVIVSNFLGSVTSAPALLRVKSVALYAGDQLLTNGTYVFASPPTLSIRYAFSSGSAFYTLDGSSPTFASTFYSGPFTLTHSATVRAIAYSADFLQSEEADAVAANVLVNHKLTVVASGGGSVSLNPPGGTYINTNTVTATAQPSAGWSFLHWLGDASGTNAVVNVAMDQDRAIQAVFGTTLSTTVAGSGQILLNPPGGLYAYGATVRLTGVPQPGNYFGFWGNAATGSSNPLYFTILNPTQTVSSIFGALSAGQVALTLLITGGGHVTANPSANAYALNQTVTLTAVPDSGQSFVNWTGDASGSQNPLSISMSQSRVITANFSSHPALRASLPGVEGLTPEGFRLTLLSGPQQAWQILGSTNLNTWDLLGTVTNTSGEVQFIDPAALGRSYRFYKAAPAP
jgi:hypothetical protein